MATAAGTNKVRRAGTAPAATAPRRRWWRRTIFLVGLPALLWFAPVIAGFGPILNSIISLATRDFKGTITVGGASLGWISHVVLHDIEMKDAEGRSLASIPQVASDKTLIRLLASPSDLGAFRVDHPQVNVVLNERDSNVEEAVKAWTAADDPERPRSRRSVGVSVVIDAGTVTIDDTAAGRSWQIDDFACEVAVPRDEGQELVIAASGRVSPGEPAGQFALQLQLSPGQPTDRDDRAGGPLLGTRGEFAL